MLQYLWLLPMGAVAGTYGTIVGAGGGILIVPLLLLAYPDDPAKVATGISLAVVFFNGLSASIVYARMRRIDYKLSLFFAATAIPGSVLGALSTGLIPRRAFEIAFAILILALGVFLALRPGRRASQAPAAASLGGGWHIGQGYTFNPIAGGGINLIIGYASTLVGIGGGILMVPAMVRLLGVPVHIATATSLFVLVIKSLTASLTHAVAGTFRLAPERILFLAIGTIAGAQLGARLSLRMRGELIMRLLAAGLAGMGIRLLVGR